MFANENYETKGEKTKEYEYLDGLFFLFMFSSLYEDLSFKIDEELENVLIEIIELTKKEYNCEKLEKIPSQNIEEVLKYIQNNIEDAQIKMDNMGKKELKALQKHNYILIKKIYNIIKEPTEIRTNNIQQKINDLSFYIACAQTKKEQDKLFKQQDKLFEQETEERNRIEKLIENDLNKKATLSACLENSQFIYSMPVKKISEKIKNYFDNKCNSAKKCDKRDF